MFNFFDRNSDKTRALWDMVDQDQIDGKLLEQAEDQVKHFFEMLEQEITTRKKTIAMLKDLASDLDNTPISTELVRFKITTLELHASETPDGVAKMEDAQKILDKDKQTLEGIDECYSDLVRTAKEISDSNKKKYGTKEHVLCSVLMGSKSKGGGKNKGSGLWGLL